VQRLAPGISESRYLYDVWGQVRGYPALFLTYSAGISALSARKFSHLAAILLKPRTQSRRGEASPLIAEVNAVSTLNRACKSLIELKLHHTPGSDYLASVLEPLLKEYMLGQREFLSAFGLFEYFLSLVYWHTARGECEWALFGPFVWRRLGDYPDRLLGDFVEEAEREGEAWGLYAAGFFNDANGLHQSADGLRGWIREMRQQGNWI
jgi:hypothetical protein